MKVFSTQINGSYYALKLLNKKDILKSEQKKLRYFLIEKEIGEMANECKFLVNTVCTFQNDVNIYDNNFFHWEKSLYNLWL